MSNREQLYYYQGQRLTFDELPTSRKATIIEASRERRDAAASDPELIIAERDYRSAQQRKKRRRTKALAAILQMRGINTNI